MKKHLLSGIYPKLTIILMMVLLPLVGLMIYSVFDDLSREIDIIKEKLELISSLTAAQNEQLIRSAREVLKSLSSTMELHECDPVECRKHFLFLLDHFEQFSNFGALCSDGAILCSVKPLEKETRTLIGRWFQNALEEGAFRIGRYHNGRRPERPLVIAAYPVLDPNGAAQAVVFAVLDPKWILRFEAGIVSDLPRGYTFTTVDDKGVVLSHYPESAGWVGSPWSRKELFREIQQKKTGLVEASLKTGESYLYTVNSVDDYFGDGLLHMVLGCPKKTAYDHTMASFKRNLLLLAGISGLAFLAAWLGGRRFLINPIKDLILSAENIEAGNLAPRIIKSSYSGELGQLASAFERMREKLDCREAERNQFVSALRVIHEIDQTILCAENKEKIIDSLMENLQKLVPCIRISLAEYDPDTNTGKIVALKRKGESSLGIGETAPMRLFGQREDFKKGIPHIVGDIGTSPDLPDPDRRLHEDGVRSYVNLPLISEGVLVGFLNVGFSQPNAVTQDRAEILKIVAGSLSTALRDVHAREEILRHRNALRKMAARLVEVQEEERKKIALELHDEMGQSLTAIGINLAVIEKNLPSDVESVVREKLADVLDITERTADQMSDLSRFLRPLALDNLGLASALHGLTKDIARRSGLRIDFAASGFENEALEDKVSLAIYRVMQEALNNVVKHAGASSVSIRIERGPESILATVSDNGKGFEIDEVVSGDGPKGGVGIIGMRERMVALQGTFHIHSKPGAGARVFLEIPAVDDKWP